MSDNDLDSGPVGGLDAAAVAGGCAARDWRSFAGPARAPATPGPRGPADTSFQGSKAPTRSNQSTENSTNMR